MNQPFMIHPFVSSAHELLKGSSIPYALCGGYAIELFLSQSFRKHIDIDINIARRDKDRIIAFMMAQGWDVFEFCGDGLMHQIMNIGDQKKSDAHLFCHKHSDYVRLFEHNIPDYYYLDYNPDDLQDFTYIDIMVSPISDGYLRYEHNPQIKRECGKAVLYRGGIPYLAPEIILLYKSTELRRFGNQADFEHTLPLLSGEQRAWLYDALVMENADGHPWTAAIRELSV
ncbi:MAG: hypothetical protein GX096_09390 [Clostridiales bacterium]|nr:hypothetical protein [Clostridiales bacterium]